MLSFAVLIPTHKRVKLLERTVDSLLTCIPPKGRNVRIIVIENGGQHGVREILLKKEGWTRPEYFFCEKPNKSEALNSVLPHIQEHFAIFLDDDVRVDQGFLQAYSEGVSDQTGGSFFGGGMLIDYERKPPSWLIDYLPLSAKGWHPDTYSGAGAGLAFMGCNWGAFVSDIENAGQFNALFGPGGTSIGPGDEQQMQNALIASGVKPLYLPKAIVWHFVPASRCSQWWAIKREFWNSISYGFEKIESSEGIPPWLKNNAKKQFLKLCRSALWATPQERFIMAHKLAELLGNIRGVALRNSKKISAQ